jgi:alpha-glucosidase
MLKRICRGLLCLFFAGASFVSAQSVSSVTATGNSVRCVLSNGSAVDFQPANPYMVRVEYRQGNANSAVSELMDSAYSSTETFTSTSLTTDPVVLTGANYTVSIAKTTFGIVFKNSSGTTLYSSTAVSQYTANGTVIAGNYYGFRNQSYTNNGGTLVTSGAGNLKIFDPANIQEGGAEAPFSWTTKGFGIIVDAEDGYFNFSSTTTLNVTRANPGCTNTNCLFWLISGTPLQIMSSYYKATGSFPVPPKWTCGFMNSEWGMNEAEFKTHVTTYRSKNIPIDAFILDYDWFFYNQTNNGDFKWNTGNYADVSTNFQAWPVGGAVKQWADAQGIKFIGIRKPHGIWTGSSTWGNCGDFYNATIRTSFWENFVDPSYDSRARGIMAYWNDEAESCNNGQKPLTPTYMQKCLYMGQRYNTRAGWPQYHNDRVWSINRSYFCGAHRYAYAIWSGDDNSTNQSMQDNRKFMLTTINLGSAWWSQDIGGFQGHPSNDDYQHWMQFGAFTPVYRVHGTLNEQRQPWVYGTTAEAVAGNAIRLRYTLIPYIYSAYWKLHRDGVPLVRPLMMDYPADNTVASLVESWMFGDNMLVSPVLTNYTATTKSVYLPAGNWYNFWTDATYTGGANVSIPVTGMGDTIPILVKQGGIIPRQPVTQYTNNYPLTQNTNYAVVPVTFHVYGGANSTYDYTDDDGVTYNYEGGQYRYIVLTHTSSTGDEQVNIGAKTGTYAPAADSNGYFVFHGITWTPVSVSVQSGDISGSQVAATALSGTAAPAWAYDAAKKQVLVKVASPFTAGVVRISSTTGVKKIPSSVALRSTRIMMLSGRLLIPVSFTGNHELTVRLITASGAVVKQYRFSSLPQGDQTLSLAVGNLAPGTCFASLSSGEYSVLKKILVVR